MSDSRSIMTPIAIAAALAGLTPAPAVAQAAPAFETTEIAEGVFRFRWQNHVGMFVVGDDGVLAFDPIGTDAAAAYAAEIRRVTDKPVRWIVYSHSDADHSTGATVLAAPFGGAIPIVATAAALDEIADRADPAQPMPTVVFDRAMTIDLGDKVVELHYFGPSHSDNMLVGFVPDVRIAFAVDFVNADRVGYQGLPDWHFPGQNEAIRAMLRLDVATIVYGHGPVGDRASLERQLSYYEQLEAAVRRAIADGLDEDAAVDRIRMPEFAGWAMFDDWFALNVRGAYRASRRSSGVSSNATPARAAQPATQNAASTRYIRYMADGATSWGILEGGTIRQLEGNIFETPRPTGRTVALADVRLLAPVTPSKVIAVGLNYRSHIGTRPVPEYPGLFAKYPTSIVGPDDDIVLPADATNAHYEGELVLVIGRRAKDVPVATALDYVFGVTAGNDISERDWQAADLQWFRAKATDTFAPIGPVIATGLNYDDLLVQTRVNGESRQSERTSDLIYGVADIVSYVSRYITLLPGDVIFTGTPQTTRALQAGDIVEVEVEGVGVLRNRVTRARGN